MLVFFILVFDYWETNELAESCLHAKAGVCLVYGRMGEGHEDTVSCFCITILNLTSRIPPFQSIGAGAENLVGCHAAFHEERLQHEGRVQWAQLYCRENSEWEAGNGLTRCSPTEDRRFKHAQLAKPL
jgi:hypothetical protein